MRMVTLESVSKVGQQKFGSYLRFSLLFVFFNLAPLFHVAVVAVIFHVRTHISNSIERKGMVVFY